MTSAEADVLIIAFARLLNASRILVVGSQAFHARFQNSRIDVVEASREIDLIPLPFAAFEKWYYYAHEKLGVDSEFDEQHGLYVDMLRPHVPKLPAGWEDRVYERTLQSPDGRSIVVVYPEIHDLIASKLLANRPRDVEFLRGIRRIERIDLQLLEARVLAVPLDAAKAESRAWALNALAS